MTAPGAADLVEIEAGFACYTSAEAEARFLHRELFQDPVAGRIGLPGAPVIVDGGAHIGLFTLSVKRLFPRARVVAVEPVPGNVALLRRNLALHGVDDVAVHEVCLGARPQEHANFTWYPAMPGNSTRHPQLFAAQQALMAENLGAETARELTRPERIAVRVERLSQVLAAHPELPVIDLVKLDVEGSETEVLDGIDDGDWARINAVLIEASNLDGACDEIERRLRRRGFAPSRTRAPYMWPQLELYDVVASR
jgi:FkbM family methyltransferase